MSKHCGIKDCDEGCDHYLTFNPFSLTDPHTQHYPLTQIQQENKYTLTVHTTTQTHTNPTCMDTNGCSYTPTPHGPCATQSFPHYSSAICHFPHSPLSSTHIRLARYWPSTLTHTHTHGAPTGFHGYQIQTSNGFPAELWRQLIQQLRDCIL